MDVLCEKTTAFSLQSIFNQVLKPLDVKTKFYNAEVGVSLLNAQILAPLSTAILKIEELYCLTCQFLP